MSPYMVSSVWATTRNQAQDMKHLTHKPMSRVNTTSQKNIIISQGDDLEISEGATKMIVTRANTRRWGNVLKEQLKRTL